MNRPIRAVIDTKNLAHNLSVLKSKAAERFFWAVVKANSYGHGLLNLLDAYDQYADGLALLEPSTAKAVREKGWTKPILLIEGFFAAEDLDIVDQYDIQTVVHNDRQIQWLSEKNFSHKIKVHVKCNTGMNRLGFLPEKIDEAVNALNSIPNIEVVDVLAHFANSEITYKDDAPVSVPEQLSRLEMLRGKYKMCLSNTSAILWHPEAKDCAVRAGVAMYGVSPDGSINSEELNIKTVMTFESEVIAFQNLKVGDSCGYGSAFTAQRPTRLAVIACGYADGYPRMNVPGRVVVVNGKRAPVIGNVSMDMMTIDVTDIDGVELGSKVELWGPQLPVNEVAKVFKTIGYELLCDVNERVPRIYKRD